MARCRGLLWILVLLAIVLSISSVNAEWTKNGVPVCGLFYDEYYQSIIADGEHGAIIIWQDGRTGMGTDLFGNKIEEDGYIEPCGLPLCTADGYQYGAQAIPDGTGGAIAAWIDYRSGSYSDIYAQRVDGDGVTRWAENGIPVCEADNEQYELCVISDGGGGAIIVWGDYRNVENDIYAQRITADGDTLWQADGIPVDTSQGDQGGIKAVPDGSGGAIVVWMDSRDVDWHVYGQRIDGDGNLLWGEGGVPICLASIQLSALRLVATPDGGAIAVWNDDRTGYWDVYAQRIDQNGMSLWDTNGLIVCPYSLGKYAPCATADSSGGVIVVWYDERSGYYPLFAQRIDADGNLAWSPEGVMVFPMYGANEPNIIADGSGGAFVALDLYFEESGEYDIYVQKLDHDGNLSWGPVGSAACTARNSQNYPHMCSDERGGLIVAWDDYRSEEGYSNVYLQRIGPSGLRGNPEPEILSCADMPADQGGWVRITTRASALDVIGESDTPIFGYNVWRELEGGGVREVASAMLANAPAFDRSKVLALLSNPATAVGVRVGAGDARALGLPEGSWESVGFWLALQDTIYNIAVPTKNDSTEAGIPYETFIVTAHTSTAGVFVASEPVEGYSVDNLAPGMTGGFAGAETASPAGLQLTWAPNTAPDVGKYNVYRGDDEFFVPDETSLLGSTTGTAFHDDTWVKAYSYLYKLVAVDIHGNIGAEVLLGPQDIGVGTMLVSFAAVLRQSAIEVTWAVSEAGADSKFNVLRSEAGGAFEELSSPAISREGLSFTMSDCDVEPGMTYRYRVAVVEENGPRTLFETEEISTPEMPLTLHQNHPNPFNPSTTISYYLPASSSVRLEVYDTTGRLVSRLIDGEVQERGTHEVGWRGLDGSGRAVSSGVYFYRLTVGKETISKKMVLVR